MNIARASGKRGSWFADVNGESMPCVHKHWARPWPTYCDPEAKPGIAKWDVYIEALRKGRAILTSDEVDATGEDTAFRRTGYIAVFAIDDIAAGDNGLTFRFTQKLLDLA